MRDVLVAIAVIARVLSRRIRRGSRGRLHHAARRTTRGNTPSAAPRSFTSAACFRWCRPTARVRRGGKEEEVAATELQVGDVRGGGAQANASLWTVSCKSGMAVSESSARHRCESMPVDRSEGDEVFVGNAGRNRCADYRSPNALAKTRPLARIAQLVESAQQREAPIQRTLDPRGRGWLVPIMLTLSALVLCFLT